jgi:hypothetical protein
MIYCPGTVCDALDRTQVEARVSCRPLVELRIVS